MASCGPMADHIYIYIYILAPPQLTIMPKKKRRAEVTPQTIKMTGTHGPNRQNLLEVGKLLQIRAY